MCKIHKFIILYLNAELITDLSKFIIKPLVFYNNNYYLKTKIFQDIKNSILEF